jgi:hypothetical protein
LKGLAGILQEQEFGSSTSHKLLQGPYNSICAGTWMSTPKVAIELWDSPKYIGSLKDNGDDQRLLNRMFDDMGQSSITPDINFSVFMTLFPHMLTRKIRDIDDIRISNHNTLISGITNSEPILLHALCNADIQELLEKLNFNNTNDLTTNEYIMNKTLYHTKTMIKHSWVAKLIVFIAFIILMVLIFIFVNKLSRGV